MRLTLRTLLSYLDNVLDEESRAALQKQIDSSEHASEWIYRTRDVTRRLKLGAPEPEGTGSVDDPNTVAEYLDRTLPEESVAEFERVCLESDALLAEVASCHHVLAMVLTEASNVDPDTRRRLHRLQEDLASAMKSRIEPAHPTHGAAQPDQAPPTPETSPPGEGPTRRIRPAIPDGGEPAKTQSPLVQWAPAIAALVLLALTALLTLNRGGAERVAAGSETSVTEKQVDEHSEQGPADQPKAVAVTDEVGDSDDGADAPTDSGGVNSEQDEPAEQAATLDKGPDATPDEDPPVEAGPDPEPLDQPEPVESDTPSEVPPPVVPESDGLEEPSEPLTPVDETDLGSVSDSDSSPVVPDEPAPPEEPATVLYIGPPESLTAVETTEGPWARLAPGMETSQQAHVASLPTYSSTFQLGGGVQVELIDQSEARINPEAPGVELLYGRMIVSAAPDLESPATIAVTLDGVSYEATLGAGAAIAVAADRFYEVGRDIRSESPPMVIVAHALGGDVTWASDGGSQSFTEPKEIFFIENLSAGPTEFADTAWIQGPDVSIRDQEAAPRVAAGVPGVGGDLLEGLKALEAADSFNEARSLAARCALVLGDPDPLVNSFKDELYEPYWTMHWDLLRQAAARSPAAADDVFASFAGAYGRKTGAEFFKLLTGLTRAEIGSTAQEASVGLVPVVILPKLESDDLASRVVGWLALNEAITPIRRPFRPTARASERRTSLRLLNKALEEGEAIPLRP